MIEKIIYFICLISSCNENCPFYDGPFTFGCSGGRVDEHRYNHVLEMAIKCVHMEENKERLRFILEECPEKIPEQIMKVVK